MKHFGEGGLFDYLLSEITWIRQEGYRRDFVGKEQMFDPHKWWQMVLKVFSMTDLKRNSGLR